MPERICNTGIFSHVDAGKTTITEQFLFLSGALREAGDVNKGTTVSDHLEVERARGVSVRSADVAFGWKDCRINLIDTPGHTDFSAEVERALRVIDGAILVVSAVEGVQAHTYAIWEAIKQRKIPVVVFINKIDRQGSDYRRVLRELQQELGMTVFPLFATENEGSSAASIYRLTGGEAGPDAKQDYRQALENLASLDEELLEAYLENEKLADVLIEEKLKACTLQQEICPVLTGVAKNGTGMEALLDAVAGFFPKQAEDTGLLSALVYRVHVDPSLGRLAHVRLFDGSIRVRDQIMNLRTQAESKAAQLRKSFTGKMQDTEMLQAGDTGIVSGLQDVQVGDVLGSEHAVPPETSLQVPLMTVQVNPVVANDFTALAHALEMLNMEDPRLGFRWYRDERELHIDLMGPVQMEILQAMLISRFGVEASFGDPTVIYKETPATSGTGFASYTMPKPCWAVVQFAIKPGVPGSGIRFHSLVSTDKIKQKYQNEIAQTVPRALTQGIKGWEVTDIDITLVDGEDHEIHSRPGDFIIATPMALMQGLTQTGTTLLEPVLDFVIRAPEDLLGRITADIHKMRGTFNTPDFTSQQFVLRGRLPAATSLDYGIRLGALSGGKARLRFSFHGYEPCPDSEGRTRSYKGVNPLDTSRWILHARGAFRQEERRM